MKTQKEVVRTIQRGDKVGALMDKNHYEQIKTFLLKVVEEKKAISINELLSRSYDEFQKTFKTETGWFIYNVKLDLEARGLISQKYPDKKRTTPMITTPQAFNETTSHSITDVDTQINKSVKNKFVELFRKQPLIVHAPGRINLIGEHTDYNEGFVMPAAIDKGVQFAIGTSTSETIIYSLKYQEFLTIDLNNIRSSKVQWQNYLLGVLNRMNELNHKITPFCCVFEGDLPTGAGLSSSAAMECGFAYSLNTLFDLRISELDLVNIAQWAEHNYVGVKCGIMDQFASMMGKENQVIQLDCKTLGYKYLPLQLKNYCLILCDTNVKHSLASSEYNTRREECEKGVRIIQSQFTDVVSLRDVSPEMLKQCKGMMNDTIYQRCDYVVSENIRVLEAASDLQRNDLEAFGQKMYETHEGLSKQYQVSCDELDFLVDITRPYEGILGSRMMGGGFGGCTLNIIENNLVGTFISYAKKAYKQRFSRELSYYVVKTGKGTTILENPIV